MRFSTRQLKPDVALPFLHPCELQEDTHGALGAAPPNVLSSCPDVSDVGIEKQWKELRPWAMPAVTAHPQQQNLPDKCPPVCLHVSAFNYMQNWPHVHRHMNC